MTDSEHIKPSGPTPSRDEIAAEYFQLLPYPPYPVQEEALLAWFTAEQGVLVCAPTGTGKTLIAEAAIYEALRSGTQTYYTTPLIALTDQKFEDLKKTVVGWGYSADDVGLITGNRRVNAEAPVLVVVAEILLNRLLQGADFDFSNVSSVVMDEFHSFNDVERGIVWELSLGLLPPHVRTLLLSATVGNSVEFTSWLSRSCNRRLQLVQSTDRKVPLSFQWVGDHTLDEWIEKMVEGSIEARRTPALIFCFNRDECWQVAELLKGKRVVDKTQQAALSVELDKHDWSQGAGPKLKQILQRGIGVHHAGVLPKYRRIVEDLFQAKLLSVAVCTETLSAGINLPARSVVLPTILKGPKDKRKVIEPSAAQQIFGRAGRPQFDKEGFVYALAHEDDVKMLRWREKYDSIPEDTKDPGLLRAKKAMKKKMPRRRDGETYWTEDQFQKLRVAPAAKLASRGQLPWRLMAYMLLKSPEVGPLRELVSKRLLDGPQLAQAHKQLNQMLITLWTAGYVQLEPKPVPLKRDDQAQPQGQSSGSPGASPGSPGSKPTSKPNILPPAAPRGLLSSAGLGDLVSNAQAKTQQESPPADQPAEDSDEEAQDTVLGPRALELQREDEASRGYDLEGYRPDRAVPTERLDLLVHLRTINPLYGVFLAGHLSIADDSERLAALESALEVPGNVARLVRVPPLEELPAGPLATERLDNQLLELGLATAEELVGRQEEDEEDRPLRGGFAPFPPRILTIGEKLRRLFNYDFPRVHDVFTQPVWIAGEVLLFDGNFNKYITAYGLQKQEGILLRHLLRLILLLEEMASIPPIDSTPEEWEDRLDVLIERLTKCCRDVDPESTDEILDISHQDDELTKVLRTWRRT
ncbi:MAG: DEAD/DEAH box helicase [Pirellulaceae bacterium]|nr:DEAD/DEAH box helicase [Pirellulaceae bacterium]